MRIIVCIKQVPLISALKFDKERKTLIREGVPNEVSAFDVIALTEAIRLRQRFGGEVIALTLGPQQAREALVECLAIGADRAVHLTDRAFAGSDTLATSRTLALAVRRLGFDLVFCGRNSLDSETGQVGPELAEMLDIPQVTAVRKLEVSASQDSLVAERETDDGIDVVECRLPALLTAAEALNEGSWPTPEQRKAAGSRPVETLAATDMSPDLSLFGFAGSPTYVKDIYSLEPQREGIVDPGEDLPEAVEKLVRYLVEKGLFTPPPAKAPSGISRGQEKGPSDRGVWVVAEVSQGSVREVTLELLGKGIELAWQLEGRLSAALLGHNVRDLALTLAAYGAEKTYLADAPVLASYDTGTYTRVLAEAIRQYHPEIVLVPSTAWGRDLAPRVASRLQLGLTGDCIGLDLDQEGRLVQLKPAFGGNIVAPILTRSSPQMATIRSGMLEKAKPDWSRRPVVEVLDITDALEARTKVLESSRNLDRKAQELETADVVVSAGMGIGGPENLPVIEELARVLGASVGGSRNVTDRHWLPKQQQVGLTGKAIAPRFYLAIGIRGDFNHLVGIQKAGTIVAVNKNQRAPIFKNADYGIVGDYAQVVPALTRALEEARAKAVPSS